MNSYPYTTAVILAAGSGTRMGCSTAKQELCLLGESLLLHTLRAFEASLADAIVVVVRADEISFAERECRACSKVKRIVVGGADRRESAAHGFAAIPEESELVAIHDAARPLITPRDIDRTIELASICGAVIPVTSVTDTVKTVGEDGLVLSTLDRANLRLAATPQVFRTDLYATALAATIGKRVTDDAMMLEMAGIPVKTLLLEDENRKVTTQNDLAYAEYILERRKKL